MASELLPLFVTMSISHGTVIPQSSPSLVCCKGNVKGQLLKRDLLSNLSGLKLVHS